MKFLIVNIKGDTNMYTIKDCNACACLCGIIQSYIKNQVEKYMA